MRLWRMPSLAVFFAAALFSTHSYSQSAPPVANAYTQEMHPSTVYGSGAAINSLTLQTGANNGNVYIQFSLAGLPVDASIQKATLQLYVNQILGPGSFDVYQLNSEWSQTAMTYTNAPAPGASATGNNPVAIPATADQFILIDVTPLVQGWLNGTIPNDGLVLSMTTSSGGALFDSKEAINTSHMPELQIVLNGPAGPQGPIGPAGPPGTASLTGPQTTAGPGFNFRNAFDPTAAYSPYDVVTYNGSTYDAIATITPGGATPDMNTSWALMAQQGATGAPGPQGPIGLTGATGAAGPPGIQGLTGANGSGFNFRNAFDPAATYSQYDVVTYNGSTYDALATIAPGGATPDINAGWALMAQQGAAGATGAIGPQGPMGPAGPPGATTVTGPQGTSGTSGTAGSSFNFRNAFDPTATYSPYDVVTYNGSTYDAIATITPGGATPDVNASWTVMAQQGAAGATGAAGPAGPIGLPGVVGATGVTGPQGPLGLTGATGPQGTAGTGFNFRTAFDPTATYSPYDVVTYNGSTYDALTAIGPGGATPDLNTSWALMAQQGAKGIAGTAGPNALSIGTTSAIAGIIKGYGGALAPAIPGTDYVIPSGNITGNAATATQLSTTGSNGTFWGVFGGVQGFYQPGLLQGLIQQSNSGGGNCQAVTVTNGTATVNWATSSCAVITANGSNVSLITLSNPSSGAAYSLGLCNDGSPRFWALPGTLKQASMPNYPSECVYKIYTYDGANYQGPGSTATPTVIYGSERSTPASSAPGAFVCWWDSVSHVMTCNDNASGSTSNMVIPATGGAGGQFVQYIDSAGNQHLGTPSGSGTVSTSGTVTTGAISKFSGSTSITNAAATDIVNLFSTCSGTQYLGADGACHAGGTGTVTSSGSPSGGSIPKFTAAANIAPAAASDIVNLFSTCSGTQYLGADGACHTASGSGTVTSSGSPVFGNISKFTTATNIVPASALDIINLFSACSGSQYLGADGACHSAAGGGTVTGVSFTGDGVVDSSTPTRAVTTNGTVAATILTQNANTGLWGPASGSAATPTFRSEVLADLPVGTVYSVVPSANSSDTLNCGTTPGITSNPVAFETTISRPPFTQTAGAIWQVGISGIASSTASSLTFTYQIKDGGTIVYTSGSQTNGQNTANLPVGAAVNEQISGSNLGSAALTVYPIGEMLSNFGQTALNHTPQTTGYNSNTPATLSVLMECSAATAGNSVTLTGLTLTKIY
jgi:hypothetical protein